jgi:GT2 family glycosyltransferase
MQNNRILPFVALLALMVAVATDRYGLRIAGTNFRFELVAAVLLVLFVVANRGLALVKRVGLIEVCLIGWLLVSTLSSLLFSPARAESLKQTLLLAVLLCIYAATVALVTSGQDLIRAALAWVAIGSAVALVGLVATVAYIAVGSRFGISLEGSSLGGATLLLPKVHSTMWEPNIFGSYQLTVWALAFALGLAPGHKTPRRRRLLSLALLLSCAGIVISISRADWLLILLLAAAMVVFALRLRLAPGRLVLKLLVPSVAGLGVGVALGLLMQVESCAVYTPNGQIGNGLIAPSGVAQETGTYTDCVRHGSALLHGVGNLLAPGTTSSATGRVSEGRAASDGWLQRPILGWGTNAFQYVYGVSGGGWIGNLELHILFDTGIVGLILLGGAVAMAGRRGLSGLTAPPAARGDSYLVLLGTMAGAVALLLAYQFTDATWLGFTWMFFALLVTAGRLAASSTTRAEVEAPPSLPVDQSAENSAPVPVTVAVVNWNSGLDLQTCIEAVKRNTRVPFNVIVVDNASTDDSLSHLDETGGKVHVIRSGKNLGFAGGVNLALGHVDTPFVLLLNPDAFVSPDCVDALVARAHANARAAAVGSGLRNPDGSLQVAARNFPSPATHFIEAFRLYKLLRWVPGLGGWYLVLSKQRTAQPVDWVVGACMLIRMAAVRDVGPFDNSFFMYAEELDWCLRAHRKGWEVWFEPEAVATHRLGGSSRQNELPLMIESYRSMYRFYAKYYPPSWTAAARVITRAAMVARALVLPFRREPRSARLAAYREIARL